jgi:hypothetical protein
MCVHVQFLTGHSGHSGHNRTRPDTTGHDRTHTIITFIVMRHTPVQQTGPSVASPKLSCLKKVCQHATPQAGVFTRFVLHAAHRRQQQPFPMQSSPAMLDSVAGAPSSISTDATCTHRACTADRMADGARRRAVRSRAPPQVPRTQRSAQVTGT